MNSSIYITLPSLVLAGAWCKREGEERGRVLDRRAEGEGWRAGEEGKGVCTNLGSRFPRRRRIRPAGFRRGSQEHRSLYWAVEDHWTLGFR